MEHAAIADNWSLQSVLELLGQGLSNDDASLIVVEHEKDSYRYEEVPSAVIAFEALFDLIADLVLRDQIWVDEKFADSWLGHGSELDAAAAEGVILPFRFLAQPQELNAPRDEFVSRLCATSALHRDHAANVQDWVSSQTTPHRYLSQVLWGGAGMLARAVVYDRPYTPHPVRRRFLASAGIGLGLTDSTKRVTQLIQEKRASIRVAQSGPDQMLSLNVLLPAFASQVIRDSRTPSDLMKVALQLRVEHGELRSWLNEYQSALQTGDFEDVQRYESVLRSVSRYVDSKMGSNDSDAPSFTVGIDMLKIAIKGDPINRLRNQFGVRASINKLIFSGSRNSDLQKLLALFGERTSAVGLKVTDHFLQCT